MWASGYHVTTVGDVDEDAVRSTYKAKAGREIQRRANNQVASFRGSKYRFAAQPLGVHAFSPYMVVVRPHFKW